MGLDRKLQYHSTTGCCICGTKTSSSRFTSSARFESLFMPCFGITFDGERSGDICNACVLIVKRFRNSPRDSCKNWAHIIGSKVGPGHRSARRQKAVKYHESTCSVLPKSSKLPSQSVGVTSTPDLRTPSPMRLRHPKRFTIKPDPVKEKKEENSSKHRAVTVGCGRRSKVFRRRPVRRSISFAASNQLIDTDYWKRVAVCCGAVYKSESNDLVLIDVAKFKPCPRRQHGSLAHLKAVAQAAEIPDSVSHVLVSSSCNSTDSLSTQDADLVNHYDNDLSCQPKPDQQTTHPSLFSSPASASVKDEDIEDEDSYSVLQTDESMEAKSPSQDTDEEDDMLPASAVAATDRSILCNLQWNNRPFSKTDDPENRLDFVWSKMQSKPVNIWPSKPSTVKVFP